MTSSVHCEVVQSIDNSGTLNIFVICLDRVGSEHNIIDKEFGLALARAVYEARSKIEDGEIDVVVVCSAKKGSFMAGADIFSELKYIGVQGSQRSFQEAGELQSVFHALESLPIPTVAILNGTTLGGGLELALSCDYRIADGEHCKQIGLPEVQIGVLPGGGGCIRLPRLIGFRQSLGLLLTGKSISAQKALKLGVVDDVTSETDTILKSGGEKVEEGDTESTRCYQYNWLLKFLDYIDRKKIGNKPFHLKGEYEVQKREGKRKDPKTLSEEDLFGDLGKSDIWDEKFRKKYPRKSGHFREVCDYLVNRLFYLLALLQLWWKVGTLIPSPYHCLQNTFRCFYTGSCLEALSITSRGFSTMVTTAESKSLMNLFLVTRKLKKCALSFGLQPNEESRPFSKEFDKVFVLLSKKGLGYSAAYAQSLIYSGITVGIIDLYDELTKEKAYYAIRKGYSYALKRQYITEGEIKKQMDGLSYHRGSDLSTLSSSLEGSEAMIVVMNASIRRGSDGGGRQEGASPAMVVEEMKKYSTEVVHASLMCAGGPSETMTSLLVNAGDPRRKNTLCVEITPPNNKFPSKDLRTLSSLVAATGKFPVLTPPSPFSPTSLYLTLSFWNLAVSLVSHFRGRVTEKKINSILCKVGFTKGPFATMKELDRDYLIQLISSLKSDHFQDLTLYLTSGKNSYRDGRRRPPSDSDLAQLFMLHLGLRAMLAKKQSPTISESAIDILCVSGLIHFPPTEGGPLNYIARLGQIETAKRFEDILFRIPNGRALFGNKDVLSLSGVTDRAVYGSLFKAHQKSTATQEMASVSDFCKLRNETVLLSNQELYEVGETYGLRNRELRLDLHLSLYLVFSLFSLVVAFISMLAMAGYFFVIARV